jgi:ABC-type transporter Mla MlaB component
MNARPTSDEERWLVLAGRLRRAGAAEAWRARTGGWQAAGPVARLALALLGLVASALVALLFVLLNPARSDPGAILLAGATALGGAEALIRTRRMHAGGFEEGLWSGGILAVSFWALERLHLHDANALPVAGLALALAAARLLNPLLATGSALLVVAFVGASAPARTLDGWLGGGTVGVAFAVVLAAAALALGASNWRRPSTDRMLDWAVATLPVVTYFAAPGALGWRGEATLHDAVRDGPWLALLLAGWSAVALTAGVRRRAHAPLLASATTALALAVDLRNLTGLELGWRLVLWGSVALGAAIALDRWLRVPRAGVSSVREDDRESAQDLVAMAGSAALTGRAPGPAPATGGPDVVTPGGGRFGGGGSSGSY